MGIILDILLGQPTKPTRSASAVMIFGVPLPTDVAS
jgi:hypothetical protein